MAVDSIERTATGFPGRRSLLPSEVEPYYRALLARLPWPDRTKGAPPVQSVGLTSCSHGEGVSTIAARLAATAAACEECRVLLVDAHFAQPAAHRAFGIRRRPGLGEVLADPMKLSEAIQATTAEGLSVLAAGKLGKRASNVDAVSFGGLLAELRAEFDLVVVDLPPAGKPEDLIPLATALDGLLLVIEAEQVRSEVARGAIEQLRLADVRLLGAVLNKRR